jgi:hypothetical protein
MTHEPTEPNPTPPKATVRCSCGQFRKFGARCPNPAHGVQVDWYAIELERRRVRNQLDSGVRVLPFDNISESVVEESGWAFEVRGDTIVVLDRLRKG